VQELQADPTLPIARMPEAGVTLPALVVGHEPAYGLTALSLAGGRLLVPGDLGPEGAARRVRIAASDVSLARRPPEDSTILNILPARIAAAEPLDAVQVMAVVALGADGAGARVLARVTRKSWDALGLAPGQPVFAQVKGVALIHRESPAA